MMTPERAACVEPLPDGTPCHACRVFDALADAETVLGLPDDVDMDRCLKALQIVTAHILAEAGDETALEFVSVLYGLSRKLRRNLETVLIEIAGHA